MYFLTEYSGYFKYTKMHTLPPLKHTVCDIESNFKIP